MPQNPTNPITTGVQERAKDMIRERGLFVISGGDHDHALDHDTDTDQENDQKVLMTMGIKGDVLGKWIPSEIPESYSCFARAFSSIIHPSSPLSYHDIVQLVRIPE